MDFYMKVILYIDIKIFFQVFSINTLLAKMNFHIKSQNIDASKIDFYISLLKENSLYINFQYKNNNENHLKMFLSNPILDNNK